MIDFVLWIAAAALFAGPGVRWLFRPFEVSWAAWVGLIAGAAIGAYVSGGSLSVIAVSGLALSAVAQLANGYRLAVKYGLTGRPMRDENEKIVRAFRAAGLDRRMEAVTSCGREKLTATDIEAVPRINENEGGGDDKTLRSPLPGSAEAQLSSLPLYDVTSEMPSSAFSDCWHAANQHLNSMVQDGISTWLKGDLTPPFLEHLSFRLGNQLFLVRVEDAAGRTIGPGSLKGLLAAADGYRGWPCVMPMAMGRDGRWQTELPGWGLRHARNGQLLDPLALLSEEEIEMTDWELHQFGVQVVERQLVGAGFKVTASQGSLNVDPSIWIDGDSGREWVVVRVARYPKQRADVPPHWGSIVERCRSVSVRGHFASVSVARADANFAPGDSSPGRLLRGHGMHVRYSGLEEVDEDGIAAVEGREHREASLKPLGKLGSAILNRATVEASTPYSEFVKAWRAAGNHLNGMAEHLAIEWLRLDLVEPILEHFSFRLGNQLFFILVRDVEGRAVGPSSMERLLSVAAGCNGRACEMPMRHQEGGWKPDRPGWGLIDARTGDGIDPPALVTDERIELTDWEVQNFAVQVVRNTLKRQGYRIRYAQGNPSVDPSICFVENGEPVWAVVRAARFPDLVAHVPHNWHQISADSAEVSGVGYFASVSVAGGEERQGDVPDIRLLRGRPLSARYEGLRIPTEDDIAAAEEEFIGRGLPGSKHRRPPQGS